MSIEDITKIIGFIVYQIELGNITFSQNKQ